MEPIENSVNLLIHDNMGQQQIIKIFRNSNQPLTQESVKAIVKEVTGQQDSSKNTMATIRKIREQNVVSELTRGQQQDSSKNAMATIRKIREQNVLSESTSYTTSNQFEDDSTEMILGLEPSPIKSPPYNKLAQQMQSTSKAVTTGMKILNTGYSPANVSSPSSSIVKKKSQTVQNTSSISRRRKTDRIGKGLRHFSMKVCEKVKEKGTTTYNEVADELVEEEAKDQPINPASYDQKNIRRRVYDALNVLMAMNIISKDKKEIRWIGLPANSAQQCNTLEKEVQARKERIELKQNQLRELILQQVLFKSLVARNKESEDRGTIPANGSAIQLPFIIVNSHKKTLINCGISNDKSEYLLKFDDKFEIHDDIEVLKRMGLLLGLDKGECAYEDIERAKTMVPKSFEKYIEMYGRGEDEDMNEDWEYGDTIGKCEPTSDQEDNEEDAYTDGSDPE